MRCYICDRIDDLISYEKLTHEYTPCVVCQAIIQQTIEEYDTEDQFEVDYAGRGQDDRSHGESVEPASDGR